MSLDTVDDLQAAEDRVAYLADQITGLARVAARVQCKGYLETMLIALAGDVSAPWCRPSCEAGDCDPEVCDCLAHDLDHPHPSELAEEVES